MMMAIVCFVMLYYVIHMSCSSIVSETPIPFLVSESECGPCNFCPWELTRPEWGRFIWKESSNGSPEIVREALPVDTDVFVAKLYTDSRRLPVRDMGVVSMLALYGVVSGSACSPSSEIIPNYKAAWERQPVLIEQLRSKLDDYGDRPRMCPPSDRPDTWPFRCLPKSVAVQVKAKLVDGQLSLSEKERATTDPGAVRSSIDPPRAYKARQRDTNQKSQPAPTATPSQLTTGRRSTT